MALGDPLPVAPVVKSTIFYGNGKVGWTETYYIHCTGTTNPLTAAANAMGRVIRLRKPLLPLDTVAEALRNSLVSQPGKSSIEEIPDFGLGNGEFFAQSANPKLGWGVVVSNDDQWVEDTRVYRSWGPSLIVYSGTAPGIVGPPDLVKGWATAMQTLLRTPISTDGGTCVFAMKSFVKPGGITFPEFKVNTVDLSNDGKILITAKSAEVGGSVTSGRTLRLHVDRKKCVSGFSGRWKIISTAVNTPDIVITLDHKPCCAKTADLEGLKGVAQVLEPAYYAIRFFTLARQIDRKTGRAFFVSRGRQPGRCC